MKDERASVGERFATTVTDLAPGGDGVAIVERAGERRAVFVRGAAPGDRLEVDVDFATRPARGTVVRLLEPGPGRVSPACAWVDRCGGCDFMHLDARAQSAAHEAFLRAALPEAWRGAEIETHPATSPLAYRTRARLHVSATGGRAVVGMNEARTREPVEVERCAVLSPELEAARRALAALFDGAHGRGDAQLALGAFPERRPVLELRWSGVLAPAVFGRLERAVGDGALAGARVWCGETTRPAVVGDPTPWMRGADGAPLELPPGGFGQASEHANAALVARVAALAAAQADGKALELYAGAGNLTVALAKEGRDLVAVESSRAACEAAQRNLAARGLRAKVVEADAAGYVIPPAVRLVVLDPPRAGARDVAARLAASKVRRVVYVSCDPQTLGRDLALLAGAYDLVAACAFEMFPQTSHVELVVALERRRGARRGKGDAP